MSATPEQDPLMPRNEPSPEISGYGSYGATKQERVAGHAEILPVDQEFEQTEDDTTASASVSQSGMSTIVSALSFAAFFAILLAIINPSARWGEPKPKPWPIVPGNPRHRPPPTPIPQPHRTVEERVQVILTETPLIDGHNDLAIFLRGIYNNSITGANFKDKFENGGMAAQVDLPRLRKGMVGGAFWSAFVVCPEHASEDFSDEQYATEVAHTLQQIDLLKRLQRQYPGDFTPAGSSLDTMLAQFHEKRSIFGSISIEGLHQVSQSAALSTLRLYYELGVRAATLTWNCHNAFADAALISSNGTTTIAPYHRGGLTAAGRLVVKEMNRLGMLVDISHTSYWTQKAVLSNATSRAPVIFTHSSVYSICPHPRNVKDDILDLVKATDSLVMINFSPDFISCRSNDSATADVVDDDDDDSKSKNKNKTKDKLPDFYERNNTLHQVARHITYVGERIGYDHVGLGSDFDGIESTPRGLDGVDKYPDLVAELLRMGVSDEQASNIVGRNLLRVWRKAEEVAAQMQSEGVEPGEDQVSGY